eukprot:scpid66485/ scgid26444/ Sushi, von Willebrand factor type A, EGF and pentraxin domain-containing protein 1; Polydom
MRLSLPCLAAMLAIACALAAVQKVSALESTSGPHRHAALQKVYAMIFKIEHPQETYTKLFGYLLKNGTCADRKAAIPAVEVPHICQERDEHGPDAGFCKDSYCRTRICPPAFGGNQCEHRMCEGEAVYHNGRCHFWAQSTEKHKISHASCDNGYKTFYGGCVCHDNAEETSAGGCAVITPTCPHPQALANGVIWGSAPGHLQPAEVTGEAIEWKNGSRLFPSCNHFYKLESQSSQNMVCENGHWSGSSPVCKPSHCPFPPSISNGRHPHSHSNEIFSVVSYQCNRGYAFEGVSSITCGEDGKWFSPLPHCVKVTHCSAPAKVQHASVNSTKTAVLSVVHIQCNSGFRLDGEASAICQTNGQWSNLPTCVTAPTQAPVAAPGCAGELTEKGTCLTKVEDNRVCYNGIRVQAKSADGELLQDNCCWKYLNRELCKPSDSCPWKLNVSNTVRGCKLIRDV